MTQLSNNTKCLSLNRDNKKRVIEHILSVNSNLLVSLVPIEIIF